MPVDAQRTPLDAVFSPELVTRVGEHRIRNQDRLSHLIPARDIEAGHTPALWCAVQGHRLMAAVAAAHRGDQERLDYLRSDDSANALVDDACRHAGVSFILRQRDLPQRESDDEVAPASVLDMPGYVPDGLREFVTSTVELCVELGFGRLFELSCGAVVLLRKRTIGQVTQSWTVSELPCTVHCDYHLDRALLGVELVHESVHNWVNSLLLAYELVLSPQPRYHSPWKDTLRPAAAFFHSIMAFCGVASYLRAVEPWCTDRATTEAIRGLHHREVRRLQQLENEVQRFLREELAGYADVRTAMATAYAGALDQGQSAAVDT